MDKEYPDLIREAWPEWEVTEELGEGAFGSVYKAVRNDFVGTSCAAVKVTKIPRSCGEIEELRAEGLTGEQTYIYYENVVKDYTNEIRLMDSVKGFTNIVTIDDYKVIHSPDSMVWYILIRMELLTPLVRKVALDGMNEDEIIRLGTDMCSALEICREHNIVHRDIKPENIFINSRGDYKLGDFGVARNLEKLTAGLSRKGTPNYMAPEVYNAVLKETDIDSASRVDIYSLGMVLYWLSNGSRLPFLPQGKQIVSARERADAFARRISGDELPPPANVSPELQGIILKACANKAGDRYASASDMKKALQALKEPKQETVISDRGSRPKTKKFILPVVILLLAGAAAIIAVRPVPPFPPLEFTDDPAANTTVMIPEPTVTVTVIPTAEPAAEPTVTPTAEPSPVPASASADAETGLVPCFGMTAARFRSNWERLLTGSTFYMEKNGPYQNLDQLPLLPDKDIFSPDIMRYFGRSADDTCCFLYDLNTGVLTETDDSVLYEKMAENTIVYHFKGSDTPGASRMTESIIRIRLNGQSVDFRLSGSRSDESGADKKPLLYVRLDRDGGLEYSILNLICAYNADAYPDCQITGMTVIPPAEF
ncbi:MAG: protein kinase [Clostridia bacterium]|nr:protein kinase [Clostridia bacterium]